MATANQFAALQPYSSFDLSKVIVQRPDKSTTDQYVIPVQKDTGRGYTTQYQDVTAYVNQLQNYSKSLSSTDAQGRAFYGTAGLLSGSPDARLYDRSVQSDNRISDPWATSGNNTVLQQQAKQFAIDHPGYFQVGQDPNNRGTWDQGKIRSNNVAGLSDADAAKLVTYDPKYGYIAPSALFKQAQPDFLNKYGPYLVLAIAGGAIAAGAAAGGGAAAGSAGAGSAGGTAAGTGAATTGGTFSGIGAGSTTGSLGLSSAGATGAATGSTVAGGTGLAGGVSTAGSAAAAGFGIPATGYVGAGVGAGGALTNLGTTGAPAGSTGAGGSLSSNYGSGQYTSGANTLGNSSGGSQGLFSQDPAPISEPAPTSYGTNPGSANPGFLDELGKLGSTVVGSGSGVGGLLNSAGGLAGGGAGAAGSGGSGGTGAASPHDVTWNKWTSPTSYLQTLTNQAQPAAAHGQYGDYNPLGGTPAKTYAELVQQREAYNTAMNGYLARQRAQLGF